MDPEEVLRAVTRKLREGALPGDINAVLADADDIDANSILELREIVAGEDPERQAALRRTAERDDSAVGQFGRMAAQGATFGFADELAGLGAGVAAAVQGEDFGEAREQATEESRQRVEDARLLNPGASLASEIAGGVGAGAGAVGLLGRATGAGGRSLGGLLTSGSRTTPARAVLRGSGRAAAAGGVEEGVRGAGEAEGGVVPRLIEGAKAVPGGAAAGAITGGLFSVGNQTGRAIGATKRAGEQVADDLRVTASEGRRVLPSELRNQAQAKADEARRIFTSLEDEGAVLSEDVLRTVERNPHIQEALSPNARASIEALEAGEAVGEDQLLTFTQLDDAADNLKQTADAFNRGDTSVRAEDVRRASEAFDELDQAMRESLEGFDEAKRLWAEKSQAMRALSEGRDLAGQQADDIASAMRKYEEGSEAREFFRQGLINEDTRHLERLRGNWRDPPSAVKNYFQRGRGFEEELRLRFPSDESFEEFARRVDLTKAEAGWSQRAAIAGQAIAFLYGGTSLFGRLF